MIDIKDFEPVNDCHWRLPKNKNPLMKVDADIFANETILKSAIADSSIQQVINVASLPGIISNSLAMPDIHYGYGFCIGAVAAFPAEEGIVLPGGVGYDINCGVRLISTQMDFEQVQSMLDTLGHAILRDIPTGLTDRGHYRLTKKEFNQVLCHGAAEIISRFKGHQEDLDYIESNGQLEFTMPEVISPRANERGKNQVGTLGSGNHFIEIQRVEEIYDPAAASLMGLKKGDIAFMIHTGSRGFGHQIATDYIELLRKRNLSRLKLVDPQLIHAEIKSTEGRHYLQALNAASNFAWANRHLIMEDIISIFEDIFRASRKKMGIHLVYDQAHNIAKFEDHMIENRRVKMLVHRKGATRAFGPHHKEIPAPFQSIGQPVLIPGSMGTASYVLRGTAAGQKISFGSSAHGAGRRMSRHQAIKFSGQEDVREKMKKKKILVFSHSIKGLKEEIPEAYKDIDEIIEVTEKTEISARVAKLIPLVVVKG